jgi:glucuronyl/N-acetylglucosaminyl transferase EXT2
MLSSDSAHLLQRSRCVERFARAFGAMPLRAVEFRVDPLLYKVTPAILMQLSAPHK